MIPQTPGVPDHADPLDTRPEPVQYAAKVGGLLSALLVAVGGIGALFAGGLTLEELDTLGFAIGSLVTAAVALGVYLLPVWQAAKARAKVTPLADPRDSDGTPLVPVVD